MLAGLNHPSLVAVLDAGEDDGWAFLVLRLVDGGTLAGRLRDGPLAEPEAAALGAAVAAGLAEVHGHGLVHRDVTPDNVLRDTDGNAYLTDFGIARLVDRMGVTASAQPIGTAAYLAPEQVRGARVGPPADVYALGLVLLECLTGTREYAGTAAEAALARLTRPPQVPGWLGAEWRRLLAAMTTADPASRPSAAEVAATLRPLARPEPAPLPHPTPTAAPPVRAPAVHIPWQLTALAAPLAVAAVAATLAVLPQASTTHRSPPVSPPAGAPATSASPPPPLPTPAAAPPAPAGGAVRSAGHAAAPVTVQLADAGPSGEGDQASPTTAASPSPSQRARPSRDPEDPDARPTPRASPSPSVSPTATPSASPTPD